MWLNIVMVACIVFTVIAFSVKTIIPLRIAAMLGNLLSIIYGLLAHEPLLLLEGSILLPMNGVRLSQMLLLIRRTKQAANSDLAMKWLVQYGNTVHFKAGDVVFRKNDQAQHMYCITSGRFGLIESGMELPTGAPVGELGLFEPGNRRTQGLTCLADGQLLCVSYDQMMQLYYQNPQFGFYLMKLISERLRQNGARASEHPNRPSADPPSERADPSE